MPFLKEWLGDQKVRVTSDTGGDSSVPLNSAVAEFASHLNGGNGQEYEKIGRELGKLPLTPLQEEILADLMEQYPHEDLLTLAAHAMRG